MEKRGMERISMKYLPHLKAALLLLLFAALASCSSHVRRDGPPNYDVDVSKIPNATPKAEPMAKYGNMPVYRISGKRYYTMKSSRHFEQTGVASWYGTLFHERRTSSGEKYDMLGMTAAHKSLPLPTYVEVTNLQNHRKIIVKVNDRGPFASNRIIDLSYVAAKKLGMLGRGTAHVRIKAINPYTYAQPGSKEIGRRIRQGAPVVVAATKEKMERASQYFYLQAGAFKNRAYAVKLKNRIEALMTFPVRVSHPAINSKLYRVEIGPIRDSIAASKLSQRLKNLGITNNKVKKA
jgi:rare lipoprotein A